LRVFKQVEVELFLLAIIIKHICMNHDQIGGKNHGTNFCRKIHAINPGK